MAERSVIVRIRAEIGDFRRQMDQAATATTAMGTAARAAGQTTSTAMTQTQASAAEARAALNDAGKAAQDAAKGFGLSYNAAGQLTDEFGNMVTEAHAAELGLETASDATREFAAQQAHATAAAGQATTSMGRLAASARDHEDAWDKAGGTLLGFGAAVVAGVGLAIAKYGEFDKAMSEVRAATHETAGNMGLLREAAVEAGADTSFSAKEAADGISELSKAGVSTKDILTGGLTGALSLAAAGSLGVADAAELGATALTQFKLSGDKLPHVADLLAAGAGKAQGSVEDLGMALKQGGLVAASTGLSIEETTGGLAAFASAGLIGSDAGTSFKTMLMALTPNSEAAQKEMDRLGISAYDQQGKFIGLSKYAGVLQTSMKGLTDEQRAATMKVIFGSDAVRAANVLYEQGAKGIADWTAAVNETGFAASTAAIKQDNLAGDIEKLGGSFDTVLIKGGSGAATALRGVVKGAESLIDGLGKIDPVFLSMGVGFAGILGAAALLGGGFLTLVPKVMATRTAFQTLSRDSPGLATGIGKVGKAAGIAAAALVALQIGGALANGAAGEVRSFEEMANQIQKASKAGDQFGATFDKDFLKNVGNISDLTGLFKSSNQDDAAGFLNNAMKMMTGYESEVHRATKTLGQADQVLVGMVKNGGAMAAAKHFQEFAKASDSAGLSHEKLFERFPEYRDSLLQQASALGINLDKNELYDMAIGKIPPRLAAAQASTEGQAKAAEQQAKMSEEAAKKLDEMGLAADGTVLSLSKLLEVMFASGLIQLSANEAAIKWQESLENMDATFAKYGNNLDITTEGGKANKRALDGMAQAGIANMQAMANNGASQEELQGKLRGTYDSLIVALGQFDITGTAADDMARQVLGIPKDVPIDTSIQNFADTMAKAQAIKKGVEDIPTHKEIDILVSQRTQHGTDALNAAQNGGATGGRVSDLMGFAGGGKVPGRAPSDLSRDNILATVNGKPFGLQSEEWVINGRNSRKYDTELAMINAGTFPKYAPSKSMAGGYGQAQSFSGYSGSAAATPAPDVRVFIGNEQIDARIELVSAGVVSRADGQSRYTRAGRGN